MYMCFYIRIFSRIIYKLQDNFDGDISSALLLCGDELIGVF